MATNAADGDCSTPRRSGGGGGGSSSSPVRVRGKPDSFLVVCRCFSVITAVAAILCIAVNVLAAVRSFRQELDIFDGIFRCYAVLIAIVVVVAETEWELMFKFWKVLEYWAGRGMLQIFVAVMTRAYPESAGEKKELILLQKIASYLLLACGFVYVISGILCIGLLKRARMKKEVSREQAAKDLQGRKSPKDCIPRVETVLYLVILSFQIFKGRTGEGGICEIFGGSVNLFAFVSV